MSQSLVQVVPAVRANGLDAQFNSMARACEVLLSAVGENPKREGLLRTPERFAKAILELCDGYHRSPEGAVGEGVFAAEGSGLVAVKDIEFYSLCEHHMLPFWGHVNIAYYPGANILGLSKLPRLVEVFSRRLQVQERLNREIAEAICKVVDPRAVAVRIRASHMCMAMRGVKAHDAFTVSELAIGEENLTENERQRLWQAI